MHRFVVTGAIAALLGCRATDAGQRYEADRQCAAQGLHFDGPHGDEPGEAHGVGGLGVVDENAGATETGGRRPLPVLTTLRGANAGEHTPIPTAATPPRRGKVELTEVTVSHDVIGRGGRVDGLVRFTGPGSVTALAMVSRPRRCITASTNPGGRTFASPTSPARARPTPASARASSPRRSSRA